MTPISLEYISAKDPNMLGAQEQGQPAYIIELIKCIATVSLGTMKIVNALPALEEDKPV